MAVGMQQTIGCCSTRPATAKSIPPEVRRVYRILSQGCLERLEPDIRKRIRPVLRGGGDGNVASLPDLQDRVPYHDSGAAEYNQRFRERELKYVQKKAAKLGSTLTLA